MSSEVVLMIKGVISEMSKEDQIKVMDYYDFLKKYVQVKGNLAEVAYALLGAEMSQ